MSWGFIVDLQVRVETKTYKALKRRRVAEFGLPVGWTGFSDAQLVAAFDPSIDEGLTFARALKVFAEGVVLETNDGEVTSLRVVCDLDRSLLEHAGLLAALLIGAGEGTLSLVNDGTYTGEDGSVLWVEKGKLFAKKLSQHAEKLEELHTVLLQKLIASD